MKTLSSIFFDKERRKTPVDLIGDAMGIAKNIRFLHFLRREGVNYSKRSRKLIGTGEEQLNFVFPVFYIG